MDNEKALNELYRYLLGDPDVKFRSSKDRNEFLVTEIKKSYKLSITRLLYNLILKKG